MFESWLNLIFSDVLHFMTENTLESSLLFNRRELAFGVLLKGYGYNYKAGNLFPKNFCFLVDRLL